MDNVETHGGKAAGGATDVGVECAGCRVVHGRVGVAKVHTELDLWDRAAEEWASRAVTSNDVLTPDPFSASV